MQHPNCDFLINVKVFNFVENKKKKKIKLAGSIHILIVLFYVFVGSANYNMAVIEQKVFFPQGLCCKETEDLVSEGVSSYHYIIFSQI